MSYNTNILFVVNINTIFFSKLFVIFMLSNKFELYSHYFRFKIICYYVMSPNYNSTFMKICYSYEFVLIIILFSFKVSIRTFMFKRASLVWCILRYNSNVYPCKIIHTMLCET